MKNIDGLPKKLPQQNSQPLKIPQDDKQLATTKARDLAAQIKSFFTPKKDLDTLQVQKINKQKVTFTTKKLPTKKPFKIIGRQTRKTLAYFKKIVLRLMVVAILATLILVQAFSETNLGQKAALIALLKDGKYLVMLQNNRELRPSGGFLGSFVVLEIKNYKLTNWQFEANIYENDKKFFAGHQIIPPTPFERFWPNSNLSLANSNWACDFPKAAQDVEWFYKEYYDDTVNGVIALNATTIVDLLKLTGPVELPQHNITLDADNFLNTVQYLVEKEYWLHPENLIINEPKTVLKDMFPILLARVQVLDKKELLAFIEDKLSHREIQLFSNDPTAQKLILEQNWGGKINNWQNDYLYLCQANLNGGKSSLNIFDRIEYQVSARDDGTHAKLIINREHRGTGEWPDAKNFTYIRLLVPPGAKLISIKSDSENTDIVRDMEANKNSFGFWLDTAPDEKSRAEIEYLLPEKIKSDNYKLLVQKQSGTNPFDLNVIIRGQQIFSSKVEQDIKITPLQKSQN